jgi:chromate transporter
MKQGLLLQIALTFAGLSLMAVGGLNAVVPEIHRQVVDGLHWMNGATFANLFAISQAAPGPNVLLVSLIGWHMAGFPGLAVATLAMIIPSSLIAFAVGRLFDRMAGAAWVDAVRAGLVPVAIGMILASGVITAKAASQGLWSLAVTAAAAVFVLACERNPLWALSGGAVLGLAVWLWG